MLKYFKYIFIIIFAIFFYYGFNSYIGSKFIYTLFGILALIMVLIPIKKEFYFFEIFFTIIIFITFWFDFVVTISFFNYEFTDGRGSFDFQPNSLNQILIISSLLFLTIIISIITRSFLFPKKRLFLVKINLQKHSILYFEKNQFNFFLGLISFVFFVSYINFHFSIFQRGIASKNEINFLIVGVIKWLLLFGFSSFFCVLIDLLISNKVHKKIYIFFYSFFLILETVMSNISILSRGNFLNSSSIVFAIYKQLNKHRDIFLIIISLVIFLFFLIGIEILSPLRGEPSLLIEVPKSVNSQSLNLNSSATNSFFYSFYNFFELIFARLFGIEALMAVYSLDNLGFNLLYEAMTDIHEIGKPTFFDSLKNDIRVNTSNLVSFTLPGIVGFLYYSGSISFLLISIFFIVLSFSFLEFLVYRFCNNNLLLCSLFSQVIAYRLWHFGHNFSNTYLIFSAILFNILIIKLFYKYLNFRNK